MRHVPVLILIFFIVSSPLFSPEEPTHWIETFELQGKHMFRVSIENYMERNGWVPVVLSFGDLEVFMAANADDLPAAGVETGISEILVEDIDLPFTIYEKNPVRTRMRMKDNNIPVTLKINRVKKQAAFYIGDSPLKMGCIRVTFKEIDSPGSWLYQINFGGKDVYTYKRFIFEPASGNIYSVPSLRAPFNIELAPGKNNVWAKMVDIHREERILINKGEKK
jgi:hypothetical protein